MCSRQPGVRRLQWDPLLHSLFKQVFEVSSLKAESRFSLSDLSAGCQASAAFTWRINERANLDDDRPAAVVEVAPLLDRHMDWLEERLEESGLL